MAAVNNDRAHGPAHGSQHYWGKCDEQICVGSAWKTRLEQVSSNKSQEHQKEDGKSATKDTVKENPAVSSTEVANNQADLFGG